MFVLNVITNYCCRLHKLVKYLLFFGGVHPAERWLRDFDEDILLNSLPVLSAYLLFCLLTLFLQSFEGI